MRRLTAAVVLGVLALVAGCSDDAAPTWSDGAGAAAGASPAPSAAASAVGLSANTRSICDRATRTNTAFGETFLADLKLQMDAAAKGESARTQARQKVSRDLRKYSSALATMAEQATDRTLKATLAQLGKEVKGLDGDITKMNPDRMANLTASLDKSCGRA